MNAFETLPEFTNSKSIKYNIYEIHNLQAERTAWSNLTPADGEVVSD